ncbi:MAG: HD domain-containing protein [Candidatus Altiarchaeota archaeon]
MSDMILNVPAGGNEKLRKLLKKVNSDVELQTMWTASNITAIDRSHMSDHGPTHVAIVVNAALLMLRNLVKAKVEPSVVKDHKMKAEDAEVVVFLASCLHDVGHIVHRQDHSYFSIPVASPIIKRLLEGIYKTKEATIVYGEVLHAILAHSTEVKPLTIEAGVVRIADALDMAEGRSRIPFSAGEKNIHSVSALSIRNVKIDSTKEKPITLRIEMTNSAGIYQVDNLLKDKVKGSGLEKYVKVTAEIKKQTEQRIIDTFEIEL